MLRRVVVIVFLVMSSIFDIRSKRIPIWLPVLFFLIGSAMMIYKPLYSFTELAMGLGTGVMLIVISIITKGQIGLGDGLLFVALGVYNGSSNVGLLICSLIICAITAGVLFVTKQVKRKDRLPFVPFVLCAYVGLILGGL